MDHTLFFPLEQGLLECAVAELTKLMGLGRSGWGLEGWFTVFPSVMTSRTHPGSYWRADITMKYKLIHNSCYLHCYLGELLQVVGGGVRLGSSNPYPISDQNM